MSPLEYLPFLLNLGLELYTAWRNNPERPSTRALDWARRGSPPAPSTNTSTTTESSTAGEILRHLPPGANAYYEAPDGTRLLVWSAALHPGTGSEGDGYRLW
ncbi:hypothetical protein C0216_30565 (plasmid) [Streptomyces globosus]|uniref:Uncharacterized protein n=1 Tax=Streptomyces globosus TaxID=68209 RepID=A0A344UAE5_9ACTN|nr:hypothetical protein [Streptomyces globosus]AXE27866.1 hypothetical protein C0216_30565 [Streptomyces globosus]